MAGGGLRVLIVGGYGTFGGRLADLLIDDPRLTLIIAGRNEPAARDFCERFSAARLVPAVFDRAGVLEGQLLDLRPDLVVDASGPFQDYGADPYALPRAAIAVGADYIDLADAAAFVDGIGALDDAARAAGRTVLSGASSFPVLTAAVVRTLAAGLTRVDSIEAGIAPSPFASVGLNVVRAIASYAGKPVTIMQNGARAGRPGFVDSRRMTIAVPGTVPLPPIRFGLADVPDLAVLAKDWPAARDIWMGAGPTPAALHRLLWAAGKLVQWRVLPSLSALAPLMHRVINTVRWGEHRGGMIVAVTGEGARGTETRSWHLLAEGERGPFIPSMAAEALIRRAIAGRKPRPGARSAHHDLELAEYDRLFAKRGIKTGFRSDRAGATPYEQIFGEAYARLPQPIQALHRFEHDATYQGRARVTGPGNWAGRLIARIVGFPVAMAECPVEVALSRRDGIETWRRTFGGESFLSTQEVGRGRFAHLIVERFGPLAFGLATMDDAGRLRLVLRRWALFGCPLPMPLAPRTEAFEHDADGRFNFSVDIALPVVGRLVKYAGWLERNS
jgi:Domain of unknown function (DUF4166)/Saccharopine dehydrogenase NADP binding domain